MRHVEMLDCGCTVEGTGTKRNPLRVAACLRHHPMTEGFVGEAEVAARLAGARRHARRAVAWAWFGGGCIGAIVPLALVWWLSGGHAVGARVADWLRGLE